MNATLDTYVYPYHKDRVLKNVKAQVWQGNNQGQGEISVSRSGVILVKVKIKGRGGKGINKGQDG